MKLKDFIVCSTEAVSADGAPEEIKILPLGVVHSQKGDFIVDDESAGLIIEQFKDRKLDLVIDYEHQTLKDVQAPAGGWVKDIYKGEDALVAKVEWTKKAEEYLKNKEYKYLSPVVFVRKKDKRAACIQSIALTNTPAIDGMFALVNSMDIDIDDLKEEESMDLKELITLLGLPETATEEDVKKALQEARKIAEDKKKEEENNSATSGDEMETVANSTVLSLLELEENAKTEDVAAAIMALKAGGDGKALAEVLSLKKELEERNADDLVMEALKAGKITAAQKDWAKAYILKDKEGFTSFMEKAPVVVPQGKMELSNAPKTKLDDYDTQVLKNCGVSEEDVKKYFMEE